jgi:hypothetical protein
MDTVAPSAIRPVVMELIKVDPAQVVTPEDYWHQGLADLADVQLVIDQTRFDLGFLGYSRGHAGDAMDAIDSVRDLLEQAYTAFEDAMGPGAPID